ncbi:MAG TPA: hypothetical protein PLB81_09555, partial [Deltaproteobacteria bacterium]|nr:hypothetical protein [Deltaproteobacteria bacterium]
MTCTTRDVCLNSRFYIAAHDTYPSFFLLYLFEGSGILDVERWEKAVAVASAADASPRMVLRRYVNFSRFVDSGVTPPVKVIDARQWELSGAEYSHFSAGFNPRTGPMTEVYLIKGEIPRVAIRAHHAVMDGRGLMTWAEDIFRALRGEEVRKSDDTLQSPDLLNPSYKPANKVTGRFLAPTGRPQGSERGIAFLRKRITGSFSKIPAKVALVSAREAWRHGKGDVRFGIPLDLRSRRPGLKSTGNLTSAIFIHITPDMNLEDIAGEINRKLSAQEDGYANIEDKLMSYLPINVIGRLLRIDGDYSHKRGTYRYS